MKFGNLHFLWLLWIIPCVIAFYWWGFKRKSALIEKFVSKELKDRLLAGISKRRQRTKVILIVLSLSFAVIALIRPKYGFHWEEVTRKGVDIVIALDVSQSMLAEDVSPNRLERAKREIIDLLDLVRGDRIGLVAFAGVSFLQCPLTLDYGAVQIFLDELSTDLIPVPGTAIGEAINKATESFGEKNKKSRVLILITDGEDHQGDPIEAAKLANKAGIKLYAIGIGKEGGAPIPDPSGGFKKDSNGELILSQLDEETLQKAALATGGAYVRSVTGNLDLEKIYQDIQKSIEDKELKSDKRKRYEERYQWPLAIAIFLLIFELLLSERSRRKRGTFKDKWLHFKSFFKKGGKETLLLFLLIASLSTSSDSMASVFNSKADDGIDAFKEQKYSKALQYLLDAQIEDPSNLELKYNIANTYYKMGDYKNSEKLYQDIAVNGAPSLKAKALYNLGNSSYKQGKLQEALQYYQQTLKADPNDEDAKHNLEFVRKEIKRRIEEQKKRQQQQQQKQQQQQNGQNKDQKGQKGDQKQQQQKQQQQQNDQNKDQKGEKQNKDGDKKKQEQQKAEQKSKAASQKDKKGNKDKKAGQGQARQAGKAKKISKEEAEKWLNSLKGDRKKFLKRRFQGDRQYQIEKDW